MRLNKSRIMEYLRYVFYILMLGTVIFIFVNSMKSKAASTEQSDTVGNIIAEIIPPDTTVGAYLQDNLRKIAHFTEYGLLGIELALYISIYEKKKKTAAALSPFLAMTVGFFDESIQILSNRGPSISDVWIDIGGFVFFSCLAYIGIFVLVSAYKLFMKVWAKRADNS